MARSRTRRRRNPTGTLLVNPRRKGRSRSNPKRGKHSKRTVSLASLLARATRSNPRKRRASSKRRSSRRNPLLTNPRRRRSGGKRRSARRNPLLTNPRRRRSGGKRRSARRNPLLTNPRRRRSGGKRRSARRNPLLTNPRRRRSGGKRRSARRNPLLTNPRRRGGKRRGARRNPSSMVRKATSAGKGLISSIQKMLRKLPLLGGALAAAVGTIGGAIIGAIAVLPTDLALPYVSRYIPEWAKPYAYTAVGMALAGVTEAWAPSSVPHKQKLVGALAASGAAVDLYRYRRGTSMSLAGEYGGGYGGYGSAYGDDGSPFAAEEWAGCDLKDAEYSGEDMSGDEIAAFELGRQHYSQRFAQNVAGGRGGGESPHAGQPGGRWGWLIYWVGHDNAAAIARLPEAQRKETIRNARTQAVMNVQKMLNQGATDTSMTQAEMAGILVAA